MSENFIHGIDEAGRIGDNIIFCEASIPVYNEKYLMIKNLDVFHKLILNKRDISGYDYKSLLKFVRDTYDDPSIEVRLYCLEHSMQNKLLAKMYEHLSERLFSVRGELIQFFDNKDIQYIQRTLDVLNAFKRKSIFSESFVKSYGIKKIVETIGAIYISRYGKEKLSLDAGPRINIQIDGGYPFSFWWYELLTKEDSGFNKGKCLILGLTNADNYYPTVSLSGTIASILEKYEDKRYFFGISPILFDINESELSNHSYHHHRSLNRPVYQNRLLIIGNINEVSQSLISYICHLHENRTKTFETYKIDTDIVNFMKDFGYGDSDNTMIIKGRLNTREHKTSMDYCETNGYPIRELIDYKDTFESVFTLLSDEIDLGPTRRRSELQSRLSRIKTSYESDLQ